MYSINSFNNNLTNEISQPKNLLELPEEILLNIFSYDNPKDRRLLLVHPEIYRISFEIKDPSSKMFKNAIKTGNLPLLQSLLKHKKLEDPSINKNSLLRCACKEGMEEGVRLLLQNKRVEPMVGINSAINYAIRAGHLNILKLLENMQVDPAQKYRSFRIACRSGHLEIIKYLLQNAEKVRDENYSFCRACKTGQIEVVKLLLQNKSVNLSTRDNCAIVAASKYGQLAIVKLILQNKSVNVWKNNDEALIWAIKKGHFDIVKLLLHDKRTNPSYLKNVGLMAWSRFLRKKTAPLGASYSSSHFKGFPYSSSLLGFSYPKFF